MAVQGRSSRRNEVEDVIVSLTRKFSLDRIMARLKSCAQTSISMEFLDMCAEKVLRLLRLVFVFILPGHGFAAPLAGS